MLGFLCGIAVGVSVWLLYRKFGEKSRQKILSQTQKPRNRRPRAFFLRYPTPEDDD